MKAVFASAFFATVLVVSFCQVAPAVPEDPKDSKTTGLRSKRAIRVVYPIDSWESYSWEDSSYSSEFDPRKYCVDERDIWDLGYELCGRGRRGRSRSHHRRRHYWDSLVYPICKEYRAFIQEFSIQLATFFLPTTSIQTNLSFTVQWL